MADSWSMLEYDPQRPQLGRYAVRDSKWPEAAAIISMSFALAVIFGPWKKPDGVDWSAVSSIATFLAVAVAIAVPAVQHAASRSAALRESALRRWIAVSELEGAWLDTLALISEWRRKGKRPGRDVLDAAIRRIDAIKRSSTRTIEAHICDRLQSLLRDAATTIRNSPWKDEEEALTMLEAIRWHSDSEPELAKIRSVLLGVALSARVEAEKVNLDLPKIQMERAPDLYDTEDA
jgi:hypothetical protein